jgi:methylmalonyl-CoA/ethylmalonyl-CoA epimerase
VVKKIQHIAIAVPNLDEAVRIYRDILGLEYIGEETISGQKVRAAFFRVGDTRIELLEPASPDSPIRAFIEKRGGGLHHIALEVEDIRSAIQTLQERGADMLASAPEKGAHGGLIAFAHPKSFSNVLVELIQTGEHGE